MAETISIRYTFTHSEDSFAYEVVLDGTTLEENFEVPEPAPVWAKLDHEKCSNCPLNSADSPYCPLALSLNRLVENCGTLLSFQEMDARVELPDRTVSKTTTAQKAISSLLGLHMATSACPNMRMLRPMARFHTPFASRHETVYRSAGTYLLGQYFLRLRGEAADLDLEGLHAAYEKIHTVNVGIARRLRRISPGDANLNALVLLDLVAQEMPMAISDRLTEIEHIFAPYFEG